MESLFCHMTDSVCRAIELLTDCCVNTTVSTLPVRAFVFLSTLGTFWTLCCIINILRGVSRRICCQLCVGFLDAISSACGPMLHTGTICCLCSFGRTAEGLYVLEAFHVNWRLLDAVMFSTSVLKLPSLAVLRRSTCLKCVMSAF